MATLLHWRLTQARPAHATGPLAGGWASIHTEPVAAIVYHVAHGDLDPEVATARLKGLMGSADTWPRQLEGWVLDEDGESETEPAAADFLDPNYVPF